MAVRRFTHNIVKDRYDGRRLEKHYYGGNKVAIETYHWEKDYGDDQQGGGGQDWSSYWATRFPSNLTAAVISDTQIDLGWTNNGTEDYDGVSIERGTDGVTYAEIDTTTTGDTSYSDTTCVAYTLYYYRIRYYKN